MPFQKSFQTFWTWLQGHWYIPIFIIGVLLGWLFFGRSRARGTPLAQTKTELRAIEAEAQAAKLVKTIGAERAKVLVKEQYQRELGVLDAKQKAEAKELEDDPQKLAKFLVRAAGSSSR